MTSFLDIDPDSGFGLQNLPYGVFSAGGSAPRVGVRVGEHVLDLAVLEERALLPAGASGKPVFSRPSLNAFMALGADAWSAVRSRLQYLLRADGAEDLRGSEDLQGAALVPLAEVTMHMPAQIGDYTDFYSSRQHATNVGAMFRDPDNALLPNWLHLPVGYHGRASSVILSGTDITRPKGQLKPADGPPTFGSSRLLDIELELGFFVGPGNDLGTRISVEEARRQIFGFVLVNDWSARDIQKWEYVPLGPFLGKSFATSISPWVVPLAALDPFRVEGEAQDETQGNPEPLDYLRQQEPRSLDIDLTVAIESESMRDAGTEPQVIAQSNAKYLYWSPEQQLAHHTVNGCNARPGDLMASGTISGETEDSYGSLLELTWRGTKPMTLPTGEERTFLADGDRVTLSGQASRAGYRVSFGEVTGTIRQAT